MFVSENLRFSGTNFLIYICFITTGISPFSNISSIFTLILFNSSIYIFLYFLITCLTCALVIHYYFKNSISFHKISIIFFILVVAAPDIEFSANFANFRFFFSCTHTHLPNCFCIRLICLHSYLQHQILFIKTFWFCFLFLTEKAWCSQREDSVHL